MNIPRLPLSPPSISPLLSFTRHLPHNDCDRLGEKLANEGIACFMLDFSGHGYSQVDPKAPQREVILEWKVLLEDAENWHGQVVERYDEEARIKCWKDAPPSFFFIGQGIGAGLASCMISIMQERGHPYEDRILGQYMVSPHFQVFEIDQQQWTPGSSSLMLCCGQGSSTTAVQPHPADIMPWTVYGHRDVMKLETELDKLECEFRRI